MGCHIWVYANEADRKKDKHLEYPMMFRVFDYQRTVLRSYDQTIKFIWKTFKKSTNDKPLLPESKGNTSYTYTHQMQGKIEFASEEKRAYRDPNLTDMSFTLKLVKEFYEKYPEGVICFG